MKKETIASMAMVGVLLLASHAVAWQQQAQQSPTLNSQQGQTPQGHSAMVEQEQPMPLASMDSEWVREFMGRKVVGKSNEELGEFRGLLARAGEPLYVVIQDERQRLHPIPAEMIHTDPKERSLSADLDKQAFLDSPSFDESQIEEHQQWEPTVRGYFQEKMRRSREAGAERHS